MEIGQFIRHIGQRVIDLVIYAHIFVGNVGHGDATALFKGHFPIAVERTARVDADR